MQYLSTIKHQLFGIHTSVGTNIGNSNRHRMEWCTLASQFEGCVIELECLKREVQEQHAMKNMEALQCYTLQQ